jgi:uncharacterized protein (DUF427 family)
MLSAVFGRTSTIFHVITLRYIFESGYDPFLKREITTTRKLARDRNLSSMTDEKLENVWDYPRPPALERVSKRLRVIFNGETIADTTKGYRVLETSHPPVYYFPVEDIRREYFRKSERTTYCEWKGRCCYYHVRVGNREAQNAAWYYPEPTEKFKPIANYVAFYPQLMDSCYVNDEKVTAQAGDFYGGWITKNITGGEKGFKGGPGTWFW